MAFQARADYQNHAIGWLQRGYSALGGGNVVRCSRIWMSSGECRLKHLAKNGRLRTAASIYSDPNGFFKKARTMDITLIVILVAVALIILYVIGIFNKLVALKNRFKNAFA